MSGWEPQVIDGGVRAATRPSPEFEKRLDFDLEAEAAVLSSIMNDEILLDEVRVWLRAEQFYSEAHRRTFEAACELRDESTPVDIVTVQSRLRANDRLKQVGADYLITVLNAAPALGSTRVKAYAQTVRNCWARRDLHAVYDGLQSKALVEATPVESLINEGRAHLDRLSIELGKSEKDSSIREVLRRTTKRLEAIAASGGRGQLPTGLDRLDRILGGLQQTLIVIAARPGMGKTSLATKIAVNVASRPDDAGVLANGVYLSSLETFDEEACTRLWCAEAGVPVTKARGGTMGKDDWAKLLKTAEWLARLPLKIDDDAAESVTSLWSKCRRSDMLLQRDGRKLKLVVVDYLQLLKSPRARMSREEIVSENTRQLLAMSNDLKCPVIALAQLNRDCEKRPNKRPVLSDLRESGEIENAARVVCFLYRDEYYNKDTTERNIAEIIVAKQNNGPTDTVRVRFDGVYTRFDNLAEDESVSTSATEPPPGFYDGGGAPSVVNGAAKVNGGAAPTPTMSPADQEVVDMLVVAVGAGVTFLDLVRAMGDANGDGNGPGMERGDVERWLARAVLAGLVGVDGDGDKRRCWRKR